MSPHPLQPLALVRQSPQGGVLPTSEGPEVVDGPLDPEGLSPEGGVGEGGELGVDRAPLSPFAASLLREHVAIGRAVARGGR